MKFVHDQPEHRQEDIGAYLTAEGDLYILDSDGDAVALYSDGSLHGNAEPDISEAKYVFRRGDSVTITF